MNYSIFSPSTRIIVSKEAVERKVKYRDVAVVVDVRRPNKVKPIYKRKMFVTLKPIAYMVAGVGIVMHPDLYRKLQETMKGNTEKQIVRQNELFVFPEYHLPKRFG